MLPLFLSGPFLIFEPLDRRAGVRTRVMRRKKKGGEGTEEKEREERGKQGGDLFIMRLRLCRGPAGEGSKCRVYFI